MRKPTRRQRRERRECALQGRVGREDLTTISENEILALAVARRATISAHGFGVLGRARDERGERAYCNIERLLIVVENETLQPVEHLNNPPLETAR